MSIGRCDQCRKNKEIIKWTLDREKMQPIKWCSDCKRAAEERKKKAGNRS